MAETYLVPVDLSPASEVGLDYALKLAKEKKARVILLHVITSARGNRREGTIAQLYRLLESEARENFSKLIERKKLKPEEFETIISCGLSPGEMIAKEAKRHRVDMIVMASHGRFGLPRLFWGALRRERCVAPIVRCYW